MATGSTATAKQQRSTPARVLSMFLLAFPVPADVTGPSLEEALMDAG